MGLSPFLLWNVQLVLSLMNWAKLEFPRTFLPWTAAHNRPRVAKNMPLDTNTKLAAVRSGNIFFNHIHTVIWKHFIVSSRVIALITLFTCLLLSGIFAKLCQSIFQRPIARYLLCRSSVVDVTINSTSIKSSTVRNLTYHIIGESLWCWQPLGTC